MELNRRPVARPAALGLTLLFIVVALSVTPVIVLAQEPAPITVSDDFETTDDSGALDQEYTWTVSEPDVRWRLEVTRPDPETWVDIRLWDAEEVEFERTGGPGRAALPDLALAPGDYRVRIFATGEPSSPHTLTAQPEATTYDAEPNDHADVAQALTDGDVIDGRLARTGGDEDWFRLDVASGDERVRDISISSTSEEDRQLCIAEADGERLQCRSGAGDVELPDLRLEPGGYIVSVTGRVDEAAGYRLSLSPPREREPDVEVEPNDEFATASPFRAELGVRGGSERNDTDFHVVSIEGEPQLWQVRASGPDVIELGLSRGGRGDVASAYRSPAGSDAVLDDLLLAPGDHVFRVRTEGSDYAISMVPLGPLDPEQEVEPNDDPVRAEAYTIGERRIGRLPSAGDLDHLRFTLAAPDRIGMTLEQPADGSTTMILSHGGEEQLRRELDEPGGRIELDVMLPPGDYLLTLRPQQPSEGSYVLTSERLDRFDPRIDQEPNDTVERARPAPPSLVLRGGKADQRGDTDWFELPPLSEPSTILIDHSAVGASVRAFAGVDAAERLDLEWIDHQEGTAELPDVPADVPIFIQLGATEPYEVRLEAPGWATGSDPVDPALDVQLELAGTTVAAYWPLGQRLGGSVRLTNTGEDELDIELDTATSHYGWTLLPDSTELSVTAGSTVEVPVELEIQPGAWAGSPTRVSVRASTAGGGRTGWQDIEALRDAPAVGSHLAWSLPRELLGGLNVAAAALGGEPTGLVDIDRERLLFDDVTPTGGGFTWSASELPMDIVVDLAGGAPVPVRGTTINPLAQGLALSRTPRDVELLLSADGETWTSALRMELQPLPIDQAWVLDAPVMATHAMLRLHSTYRASSSTVALGEWRVIAEPGAVPDDMSTNIAEPIRGGHIARHEPYVGGWSEWAAMLDEDRRPRSARFDPSFDDGLSIVIGFEEGRAAQITDLRWFDPDDSSVEYQVAELAVEVSLDGPLGPWRRVGTWPLDREQDGAEHSYQLSEPTWARYVRLSADFPPDSTWVEFPGRIEVHEREIDDEYRSILGSWGYLSDQGPYELLVPEAVESVELDPDAGDEPTSATAIEPGVTRTDQAEILEDVDWYRVTVPADHNTLSVDIEGVPSVGVGLTLHDGDGRELEMPFESLPGGLIRYEAEVEPGSDYLLEVEQPPFSVVFTFDTSGSMGPFLDFVFEGMREFASDVQPGREAAHIVPLARAPLLEDWSDQPLQLEGAVNNFLPGDESSNVEEGLLTSAELLAERDGVRAILVVADAETGSLQLGPDVWRAFDAVQPIVYTAHVGASTSPQVTRNMMRAWADANTGVYSYPSTHAEMERSFEAMSTRLRRPATYRLTAATTEIDRSPGTIAVEAPAGQPPALAPDIGVEIILDTSGSMREKVEGSRRIVIAKRSLQQLIREGLAEDVPVALRVFEARGKSDAARCQTSLALPLAPLDRAAALKVVKKLQASRRTRTPIDAALREVATDLASVEGPRTVVLITDGDESCDGDPAAAIDALRDSGIDVTLNIVGFALDDQELVARMQAWAEAGAGSYFDAAGPEQLADAVITAVSAPFRVYPVDGDDPVARGTVGSEPVQLPPGDYRVEVLTDPPIEFDAVELPGGGDVTLTLEVGDDESSG